MKSYLNTFWLNVVFTKISIFLEHTTHEPLPLPKSEKIIDFARRKYG